MPGADQTERSQATEEEGEELVVAERSWNHVPTTCESRGLRADPPDLDGLREAYDLDRETFEDRLVEHDGALWFESWISYHDAETYDGMGVSREVTMPRAEAEAKGADPCAACYPDDERNQWAQVTQTQTETEDGTLTQIEPKPVEGEGEETESEVEPPLEPEIDDPWDLAEPEEWAQPQPNLDLYLATAEYLYTESTPESPEGGRMRTEEERRAYLKERGATVAVDPDGCTLYADVPDEIELTIANIAEATNRPLWETMGYTEPPTDLNQRE